MRKNRKMTKRMSRVANSSLHIGSIILVMFIMVIINILASTSCQQLEREIGQDEKVLAKLESECTQEASRWEEMKTPMRLEQALIRHGLVMKPPRPDQNIRMKMDGTPYPGQIAVARAAKRMGETVEYRRKH